MQGEKSGDILSGFLKKYDSHLVKNSLVDKNSTLRKLLSNLFKRINYSACNQGKIGFVPASGSKKINVNINKSGAKKRLIVTKIINPIVILSVRFFILYSTLRLYSVYIITFMDK